MKNLMVRTQTFRGLFAGLAAIFFFAALLTAAPFHAAFAQTATAPPLGTAQSFAVVAETVTNGGNTVLNESKRIAQLDSLMRTAWKNNRAFQGVQRFGLLYKHFKLKEEMAGLQGRTINGFVNRKICKLLSRLSVRPYKKIIEALDSGGDK